MAIYDKLTIQQAYNEATKDMGILRSCCFGKPLPIELRRYDGIESNYYFLLCKGIDMSENYGEAVETMHIKLGTEYLKYGYKHLTLENHANIKKGN